MRLYHIERNLYLTMQLLELNIPMILALNMMDEVISSGNSIDVEGLQQALGIRVIPLSASKNEGIEELIEAIETTLKENNCSHLDLCSGEIHKAIHSITHLIEDNAVKAKLPKRFAVTKIIEGDKEYYTGNYILMFSNSILLNILLRIWKKRKAWIKMRP